MNERISDKLDYPSKYVEVDGAKMHYLDIGEGDPIVFLHGVPTSCYLWRNVIPHLAKLGRCIAPDLIGFGWSDKPDIAYSLQDHIHYITQFIHALNLKKITLVMHGWGGVVGLNYAMAHEKNCKALAFYESFLRQEHGTDLSLPFQEQLISLQQTDDKTHLKCKDFINKILNQHAMRTLTEIEIKNYCHPFEKEESNKPILTYLEELPNGNETSTADKIIHDYSIKLTHSQLPKLMLYSVPGFITTMSTIMWAKDNLPNLEVVDIGEEFHLAQESCPDLIGETISVWLQGVEQG